jgi:hypothetical protein
MGVVAIVQRNPMRDLGGALDRMVAAALWSSGAEGRRKWRRTSPRFPMVRRAADPLC